MKKAGSLLAALAAWLVPACAACAAIASVEPNGHDKATPDDETRHARSLTLPSPRGRGDKASLREFHAKNVSFGHPATLEISAGTARKSIRLALAPAAPRVSRTLALAHSAHAIEAEGDTFFLAAGEDGLLVADAENAPRIVARHAGHAAALALDRGCAISGGNEGIAVRNLRDPQHPAMLAEFRTAAPVVAVAAQDGRAYVLQEHLLQVLDVSGCARAVLLAEYPLAGQTRAVAAQDQRIYLASPQAGLIVLEWVGSRLREAGRYRFSAPHDVAVSGAIAYLADGDTGLTVLDVSDARAVRWLGSANGIGHCRKVRVAGRQAALLNTRAELVLVDVARPQLPVVAAVYRAGENADGLWLGEGRAVAAVPGRAEWLDFPGQIPDVVNFGVNFGGSRRAVARGDILYVADWFSGLHLYDIADPRSIRHLSAFHTQGSPKGVAVRGHYAFVADDDHGVQIIDVENPRAPRKISEVATPGLAYTMKPDGDYLYLADHRGGFHVIDIGDIRHPSIIGSAATLGKAWGIDAAGNFAYVAADKAGLLVYDMSDPRAPRLVSAFRPGGAAEDVVLRDGYAYVAFFDQGLYVLDLSEPAAPRPLAHLPTPGNARGIELAGNYAYIADWVSGIQIADISDPSRPVIAGAYDTAGWAWGVRVQDGFAYVLDWWGGIAVLDVADPAAPRYAGSYHGRGKPEDVVARDNYAYVANGAGGLQIFDIKNALNPTWACGVDIPGNAQSVALDRGMAYVAAGDAGLAVADVSSPFEARLISSFAGRADLVRAQDGIAYVADRQNGLTVVDFSAPHAPRKIAFRAARIHDLWLAPKRLLLATSQGLEIFDISDPRHLKLLRREKLSAGLVRAQNGLVAVSRNNREIALFRLKQDRLQPLAQFNLGDEILDLQWNGAQLYATGKNSGLWIIGVADPGHPAPQSAYPATRGATRLAVSGEAVFLAGGNVLTSVTPLPAAPFSRRKDGWRVELPPAMPPGWYEVIALDMQSGAREILPDTFRVGYSAPKKPRFTLEDLEKALKERGLGANPAPAK